MSSLVPYMTADWSEKLLQQEGQLHQHLRDCLCKQNCLLRKYILSTYVQYDPSEHTKH